MPPSSRATGWLVILAEQVPQRDVDAADGVLDGPAAALPEGVLPQLLADPSRLVGPLADEQGPATSPRNRRARGCVGAADADAALVGEHLDDGVDIVVGDSSSAHPPSTVPPAGRSGESAIFIAGVDR
jgi:hypothetical protein